MLLGVGIAPVAPAVLSAAASSAPGAPAGGVAAVSALGYAGAFAMPPLVGSLAGPAGLPAALATVVVAALGAAALARQRTRCPEQKSCPGRGGRQTGARARRRVDRP
jgi:hypothetical protein